jgi:glucosylceramidase
MIPSYRRLRSARPWPRAALGLLAALTAAIACAVLIGSNQARADTSTDYRFQVQLDGRAFTYALPAHSVATFKWTPGAASAAAYLTTPAATGTGLTQALAASTVPFSTTASGVATIDVNPATQYQTIDGFGGAMTDSSAALIAASPQRDAIMDDLFGASGARFSFVRLPVGASDFVADPTWQSYDDMPAGQTDPQLQHFSVAHDTAATIPLLQQARRLSPSLKLLATPWSAPAWMKFGGTFTGTCTGNANYLRSDRYTTYASYLAKVVKAYQGSYGLPIYMLSMQNEPRHCDATLPTMNMEPTDEATFATNLRQALDAAGQQPTRILAWDDNWDESDGTPTQFPQQALQCASGLAHAPIDAIGFHSYAGETSLASVQSAFHDACGGKDVYMTEATGFDSAPTTAANLVYAMRYNLIGPMRNWARASTYWNVALDETGGPHHGGCTGCRGMITVKHDGTYALNEYYYYWKQFSKFVDPGAVRIDSTDLGQNAIETVAFRNPDGTIVLVALHGGDSGSPAAATPTSPLATAGDFLSGLLTGAGHEAVATTDLLGTALSRRAAPLGSAVGKTGGVLAGLLSHVAKAIAQALGNPRAATLRRSVVADEAQLRSGWRSTGAASR